MADMTRKMPELLAPAGDAECLAAALQFGADAVYLGAKEYGMRAAAKNFDFAALAEAVQTAHAQGVQVHLTANILPRNAEADAFPAFLEQAAACGIDAVIAADLGIISTIRRLCPELAVHASTQTGVTNYETARFLHSLGVRRVVLARELSIAEIAEIRAKTPPDLEKSQGAKNETMSEIFSVAEDAIDKHHDIGDGHDTIVVEVGVPFVNAQ